MTIEEWNRLQVGDYIRPIRCRDLIYKVTGLEPDEDWSDTDDPIISHQMWTIDPLHPHPDDPNLPDVCAYDPGEAGDYQRCEPPKEVDRESDRRCEAQWQRYCEEVLRRGAQA